VEVGKTWGEGIPYFLLDIPTANITFSYHPTAFNAMNILEFVADQYVDVVINHDFNGFIFNRIPLLRRLKLREALELRAYYGQLSDANNPNLNGQLIQFPTDEDGLLETFVTDEQPYLEVDFAVHNIFRIIRLDFIKRLNYLDQPNLPTIFGIKGASLKASAILKF